jgi:hypothetical protein
MKHMNHMGQFVSTGRNCFTQCSVTRHVGDSQPNLWTVDGGAVRCDRV